jgi:DNA mismatch repair ATPase MutS
MTQVQTPLMQQYREIKARHQNAILFFRMGEFYEMFYEDAETASRVLGLTLTSRNNGGAAEVPLAGIPVKAAGDYVRRLVQTGYRVAICEQIEDPRLARGIVRREVVETVTPGATFADDLLDGARNNFLCALWPVDDRAAGAGRGRVGMAAAEPAAHSRCFDDNAVHRETEHVGDNVLHLGRMLSGGTDEHAAVLARFRPPGLRFEIKVILATESELAFQA